MHQLPDILLLFFASFGIAFSGALMPGPLLSLTVAEALRKGHRAGPLVVIGHAIVELGVVSLAAGGFASFLSRKPVFGTIGLVGGLVLLWMGYSMVRGSTQAAQEGIAALQAREQGGAASVPANTIWKSIFLGAVTSISNPYWSMWWVTIGLSLITKALQIGAFALGAFYIGHILADLIWYWGIAFAISRGTSWLGVKGYRTILLVCAAFLLAMGLYFGASGGIVLHTLTVSAK